MRAFFSGAQDPVSCHTHALGALAALVGGAVMLMRGMYTGASAAALAAAMCFVLSLIALYSASAIYHFCPGNSAVDGTKRFFRKMDHSMIYILIAGSYTPFCTVLLPQPMGARFCGILWCIAITGVAVKLAWVSAPRILSTIVYVGMGWAVVFVIRDFASAGPGCVFLTAAGGICYSVGAVFYAIKRPNINAEWTFHELFHLLILAGSFFHYLAVFFCVL
ncbi:MAG: hemolysin III family protein [Ruminococcaceae bacterium]|nr:hemolysin III family protein [Oscillospiraceae bacterium]